MLELILEKRNEGDVELLPVLPLAPLSILGLDVMLEEVDAMRVLLLAVAEIPDFVKDVS